MVTYLFTSIEDFERLLGDYHEDVEEVIRQVTHLIADAITAFDGKLLKHTNKGAAAFFPPGNPNGIRCALALTQQIQHRTWETLGEIRLQIALHAGDDKELSLVHLSAYQGQAEEFFGPAINRTAYLMGVGWGGQILVSEQALTQCILPKQATVRSLGRVPLKEPGVHIEVYQIDHPNLHYHRFPPLKSGRHQRVSLPQFPLPFIGRERELAVLTDMLNQPGQRLITITGQPGVGKTRLAVQVANDLIGSFRGNVFFVPLSGVHAAGEVLPTIMDALHLHPYPHLDPQQQLLSYLRNRHALLILDHVEHIPDLAPLLQHLLQGTSRLHILATSRFKLGLHYESTFPLQGFDPDKHPEAIHLFTQSARQVQPDFQPTSEDRKAIAEIIHLLDGLPQDIQQAAAAVVQFSCQQIAQQLRQGALKFGGGSPLMSRDQPSSSAKYSWDSLTPEEQAAYCRLCLLKDGFDIHAAREVAGASLFLLRKLVQRSLLNRSEGDRFSIPGTLRSWLHSRAIQDSEVYEAVRRRKHAYYIQRLSKLATVLQSPEQPKAVEAITLDLPNLLAVWNELVEDLPTSSEAAANLLDMAQPLSRFFRLRFRYRQGERLFAAATNALSPHEQTLSQAEERLYITALLRRAEFLTPLGDRQTARQLATKALERAQHNRLLDELAFAHWVLAKLHEHSFDHRQALHHARQALHLYRQLNHLNGMADSLSTLGACHLRLLEIAQAEPYLHECLDLYRQIGDLDGQGRIYGNLALAAMQRNDMYTAMKHYRQAANIHRQTSNYRSLARTLNNMSHIYQSQGDYAQAEQLLKESLQISRQIGDYYMTALVLNNLGFLTSSLRQDLHTAKIYYLESVQHFLDLGHIGTVFTYTDLAIAICRYGEPAEQQEAREYLRKAFLWVSEQGSFHEAAFQHTLFGWAHWYTRQGHYQQAAQLLAFLKRQESFQNRIAQDEGMHHYFQDVEEMIEGHLPPQQRRQIEANPPTSDELRRQFQSMIRSETP